MGSLYSSRSLDMAPIEVGCNGNNKNNNPEPSSGESREDDDGSAKEQPPKQQNGNEPEDFDVSDCFTDDLEELANGGGGSDRKSPKKNGSSVKIEKKESKPKKKVPNDVTIVLDSDGDDDDAASQDSLDTRIQKTMAKAAEVVKKEKGGGVVCENEDPDIVALKKDLYQSNGEIDYDLDLWEDEPDVKMEVKPKIEPNKVEPPMVVIIKSEATSPLKQSLEAVKLESEVIPTIDLTSSDEEAEKKPAIVGKPNKSASNTSTISEYVVVKAEDDKLRIRRKKRKSKKRSSKRWESSSDCELIEDVIPEDAPKHSVDEDVASKEVKPIVDQKESLKPSLEEAVEEDSKENKLPVDAKEAEPKEELPVEEKKLERRPSTESDYVKAAISKELGTPADSCDQKVGEDSSIPIINTDIALEDLLIDFIEDETVPQDPSQVLFPLISNDEADKNQLNSPLIDCERNLLAELDNILKDDKPPENLQEHPEQPPLFTYTINEPGSTPLNITINATFAAESPTAVSAAVPKPRIRIVDGRIKYPPPPPPAKKRPGRPPKQVDPPPKPSNRHRRYESDEEYIPSFARTRRVTLRPRKPRRRLAPRARLVPPAPTGEYLTELQLQPVPDEERREDTEPEQQEESTSSAAEQPPAEDTSEEVDSGAPQSPMEAEDGVYMNMPSLEGELAAGQGEYFCRTW